jgi:hypothetical protein
VGGVAGGAQLELECPRAVELAFTFYL